MTFIATATFCLQLLADIVPVRENTKNFPYPLKLFVS